MGSFFRALTTLTSIPAPVWGKPKAAITVRFFPLVGLIIGSALWLMYKALFAAFTWSPSTGNLPDEVLKALGLAGLSLPAPGWILSFLITVGYVFITGALHLDGLADWSDAHFAPAAKYSKEKTLQILKDTHMGTFGVIAIVLSLLGYWILLNHYISINRFEFIIPVIMLSRLGAAYACAKYSSLRTDGTATPYIDDTSLKDYVWALVYTAVALFALAGFGGLLLVGVSFAMNGMIAGFLSKRLGGMTGDLLGALIVLGELLMLTIFSVFGGVRIGVFW